VGVGGCTSSRDQVNSDGDNPVHCKFHVATLVLHTVMFSTAVPTAQHPHAACLMTVFSTDSVAPCAVPCYAALCCLLCALQPAYQWWASTLC
jgi:hypothetical protein